MGIGEKIANILTKGALSQARETEGILRDTLGLSKHRLNNIGEVVNLGQHIQQELSNNGWVRLQAGEVEGQPSRDVVTSFSDSAIKFWLYDGIVNAAVRMRSDFTLGTGFQMPVARKPDTRGDIDKQAQDVIKAFWRHPYNQKRSFSAGAQKKADNALLIYGNAFLLAKPDPECVFRLRYFYPDEITDVVVDPDDGITPVWFVREYTPVSYDEQGRIDGGVGKTLRICYRAYDSTNGVLDDDYAESLRPSKVPSAVGAIHHAMSMSLPWWNMGVSSLSPVLQWASMLRELKIGQAALVRAAQSMPIIEQLSGTGYQQSQHKARAKTDWGENSSGASVPYAPGSVRVEGPNRQIKFMDTPTRAGEAQTNSTLLLKHVAAGIGFPPHYYGDMSEANLATATSLELPVKVMVESLHTEKAEFIKELVWSALRQRFGTKGSVAYTEDDLYVDVGKPNITREDLTVLANALAMFLPYDLVTEETAARAANETLGTANVDEEIAQLRPDWEAKRELDEEMAKAQVQAANDPLSGSVGNAGPGSARTRANNARAQTARKAGTLPKIQAGR